VYGVFGVVEVYLLCYCCGMLNEECELDVIVYGVMGFVG